MSMDRELQMRGNLAVDPLPTLHAHDFAQAEGQQAEGQPPRLRVSGMLVEDGRLLIVRQVLRERAHWNIPGGGIEPGETVAACVRREMREETGLEVEVGDLLYVCDRARSLGRQTVDLSFLVRRISGTLIAGPHIDKEGESFAEARFVKVEHLCRYGFSARFASLVRGSFPMRGSYQGDFHEFYG